MSPQQPTRTQDAPFPVVWIGWMYLAAICGVVLGLMIGLAIGVFVSR